MEGGGGLALTDTAVGTLRGEEGGVMMAGVAVGATLRGGIQADERARDDWGMGGSKVIWISAVTVGLVISWACFPSRATLDGMSVSKVDSRVRLRIAEILSRMLVAMMFLEEAMGSWM